MKNNKEQILMRCGNFANLVPCWKNSKMVQLLRWKTVWLILKILSIELPYDLEIPLLSMYKKSWKQGLENILHNNVYKIIICNSKKVKTTKMIINGWKDKQSGIPIQWGIIQLLKRIKCCYKADFGFVCLVLGIEPMALRMLGNFSATEIYP